MIKGNKNKESSWIPVLPDNFSQMCHLLDNIPTESKILVVDDIDCDGQMSAYIAQESLKSKFSNIEILINGHHGFKEDISLYRNYGLIIIVDSSSELVENYASDVPVLIIDHHEYERSKMIPENVLLMNSKNTERLKNLSAGMFTYLLMSEYIKSSGDSHDSRLFSLGAITLYSDIVPVDDYVKSCLIKLIEDIKEDNLHPMLNYLNTYCNPMNRGTLSYNIIPSINYTRKIMDINTIKMMYRSIFTVSTTYIKKNSKYVKTMLEHIGNNITPHQDYQNFSYADMTSVLSNVERPLENFKGLLANRMSTKYGHPSIVSYLPEGEDHYQLSFRSPDINSHKFIKDNNLDGGGHLQACGARCPKEELYPILDRYEEYIKSAELIIDDNTEEICIEQLKSINLLNIAYENEFRFSNLPVVKYKITINKSQMENINSSAKKFDLNGVSITWYTMISEYQELNEKEDITFTLTPTMDSHLLGTYIVVADISK